MRVHLAEADKDKLLDWCREHGYSIRIHTHPKTRANWDNPPNSRRLQQAAHPVSGLVFTGWVQRREQAVG